MHLGMSGSFRVTTSSAFAAKRRERVENRRPAATITSARPHARTTMSCSTCRRARSSRSTIRAASAHEAGAARASSTEQPLLRALGPEPLGNAFDAAMLAHACHGKKTSLKAALSDQKVVAGLGNIYVCEALHRARLSPQALGRHPRDEDAASRRRAPKRSSRRSRRCSTTPSRPAARRCATIAAPTASSATSSTISASTTARASPARRPAAAAPSGASCRARGRRSSVRCVRNSPKIGPHSASCPGRAFRIKLRQENTHDLPEHPRRDPRQGRHHPAQPAAGAQCAQRRADGELCRRGRRLRGRSKVGCMVITGSDKAFAAGADIKEMADKSLHGRLLRRFRGRLGPCRARAQAGDRGGRRLCARRRLRARHAVRPHHRGRQREIRPAGDQARRHPGHRRHAAAHPRGRQGQGHGPDPDRPHDGRGRKPSAAGLVARVVPLAEPDGRGHEGGRDDRRDVAAVA